MDGLILWVNSASGAGVNSIAVDTAPSLIEQFGTITGRFTGSATFGNTTLTSIDGSDDAYNAVFQLLTGQWTSVASGGGVGSDKGRACAYKGHPYYTGSYEATADLFGFDFTSGGASDGYVYSNAMGVNDWMLSLGGVNNDTPVDVGVDGAGNVFICGWYSGLARFGANLFIHSGNDSDLDFFVAKINTSTELEDNYTPATKLLLNCYPNPFTDKLSIEYAGADAKAIKGINIYNIKGEKVQSLSFDSKTSESGLLIWNGFDSKQAKCPSGIYFIQDAEHPSQISKVLYLK
jgi:hypothetical protein